MQRVAAHLAPLHKFMFAAVRQAKEGVFVLCKQSLYQCCSFGGRCDAQQCPKLPVLQPSFPGRFRELCLQTLISDLPAELLHSLSASGPNELKELGQWSFVAGGAGGRGLAGDRQLCLGSSGCADGGRAASSLQFCCDPLEILFVFKSLQGSGVQRAQEQEVMRGADGTTAQPCPCPCPCRARGMCKGKPLHIAV